MKLYNPITKKNEELVVQNNTVKMYVCGPTVYDDLHIGNMRPVLVFDTLARFLVYSGYKVDYLSNITDIDDKIIKRAIQENVSEEDIAKKYITAFEELLTKFNVIYPNRKVNATAMLSQMYDYIKLLISKNFAYEKNGSVYFNISKLDCYGTISGQNTKDLLAGEKADKLHDKEETLDFALWKKTSEGIQYDSPFGLGRPGWHTECSCINYYSFKDMIDIHGGGVDLKFPHHENENAQYYALTGKMLARFWMYVGFVNLKDKKMSKSTGNLIKAKTLLEKYSPNAYRLLLLAHSYLQPISFSYDLMDQYEKEYSKICASLERKNLEFMINDIISEEKDQDTLNLVKDYLNDNFNTPLVVSLIFEQVKLLNKEVDLNRAIIIYNTLLDIFQNIIGFHLSLRQYSQNDIILYKQWLLLKANKDFVKADKLRNELIKQGIVNETKKN